MPSNHDLAAESAMRRLAARATAQPSPQFLEQLAQSLDVHRADRSSRTIPLVPERRPARVVTQPRQAFALLAVVLLIASTVAWIGLADHREPKNLSAIQATPENAGRQIWSLPDLSVLFAGPAEASNGVFYRSIFHPFATPSAEITMTIEAYDAGTGELRWANDQPPTNAFSSDDHGLYLAFIDERRSASVVLLDAETGGTRWKADIPSGANYLEVLGDNVIVQDWANHLTALDRESGEVRWQVAIGPPSGSSEAATPPPLVTNAFVVARAPESPLQVLDFETGAMVWSRDIGNFTTMAISNNALAIVEQHPGTGGDSEPEQITAYELSSGMPLWHRKFTSRGGDLYGTRSGFIVHAKALGPVLSDRPAYATPAAEHDPVTLGSTEQALGRIPSAPTLFGLDWSSGATMWVTDWAIRDVDSVMVVSDVAAIYQDNNNETLFVVRNDLRAGWLSEPSPLSPPNSPLSDPAVRILKTQINGPGGEALSLTAEPWTVVLDDSNVYIVYNTGEVTAFTRGSS